MTLVVMDDRCCTIELLLPPFALLGATSPPPDRGLREEGEEREE